MDSQANSQTDINSPYLNLISEFLSENDTQKALCFWLNEFENTSSLSTTAQIENIIHCSIASIDNIINDQLNLILHHHRFQQIESSWRGLWHLAIQCEGIRNIKLRVLDVSWPEVVRDISRALEFDQSQLFQKIYNDEYGIAGGEPFGVLIGDYEISHRPSKRHPHNDIATLEGIAEVAAAAFTPFIASASPELFGMDNYDQLAQPLNLKNIFSQHEYIPWRALRDKPDSRFIGLTLPRILMRKPYRTSPGSYKGVYFHEKNHHQNNDAYLWGNACYAFASILIREFSSVGWFGHIRGVPRNQVAGGLLSNLTVDSFDTDQENIAFKPSTEIIISDALERELGDFGFIPLCQCYDTPLTAFFSNQSIQKPQRQETHSEGVNAKLSSMLQHVLCGSRVAHYIKVIIRDKIGSFISATECEQHLQQWLFRYTTGREDLEWEEQARYPLREAKVGVKEHPEKPGQYLCVIHLMPHYQIDQMVSELELVTELVHTK